MKKALFIIALLAATMTAGAQTEVQQGHKDTEIQMIDRDCTMSGELFAVSKSEKVTRESSNIFNNGARWFINNYRIGDENYVSFWIEDIDGRMSEFNTWKEHGVAAYIITGNSDSYIIADDTYIYLTAIKTESGKYLVQLFTKRR